MNGAGATDRATATTSRPTTPIPRPTVGVVTIARGRRDHLEAQAASIGRQTRQPDRYVMVDMGGPDPAPLLARHVDGAVVVPVAASTPDLPLARARNLGWATANTDITIFLDVDCIAAPTLVHDYVSSVTQRRGIHAGPVGYLPPDVEDVVDVADLTDLGTYQPGRPRPGQAAVRAHGHELFWSLSFAVDRATWNQIGGFDECFVGYGGEDTDFARTAVERGVPIWFLGEAEAFHQFHPTMNPPVHHLEVICRNATTYHGKWGEWPMSGWLEAFAEASLIDWHPGAPSITVHPVATAPSVLSATSTAIT